MALPVNNLTGGGGQSDAILVTCMIPSAKMFDPKEIKDFLVGHFANYGQIVRVSCTTKPNKSRVAHIQYSSAAEASNARQNGNSLIGLSFDITLTTKHPPTKAFERPPVPRQSKLFPPRPPPSASGSNFHSLPSSSAGAGNAPPSTINQHFLPVTCPSSAPPQYPSGSAVPTASGSSPVTKEDKPNTCVKLEVYKGPPPPASSQNPTQAQPATSTPSNLTSQGWTNVSINSCQVQSPTTTAVSVPSPSTRSLSQILNLDTSSFKIVPRLHASDALASQFFYGRSHPFPIAQMFGRPLGQVIFSTKDVIDSIKPGMEIKDSSIEIIWNTIETSVLDLVVGMAAKKTLAEEQLMTTLIPDIFDSVESAVIDSLVMQAAQEEINAEEQLMALCEESMDVILSETCHDIIDSEANSELDIMKLVSDAAEAHFKSIEEIAVADHVSSIAFDEFVHELCLEVVEDLIDCPYLQGYVRILAADNFSEYVQEEIRREELQEEEDRYFAVGAWLDQLPTDGFAYNGDETHTFTNGSDISLSEESSNSSGEVPRTEVKVEVNEGILKRMKRSAATFLQPLQRYFKRPKQDKK